MKNNFINNNGATLLHTKNKKTQVEIRSIVVDQSQIELLKNQEQEMITELSSWETKQQKAEQLTSYLEEVKRFSTKYLAETLKKTQKEKEHCEDWWLEILIENKVEFALRFEPTKEAFYNLVFHKIENQISYLKSQLRTIQEQLSRQERIFARLEMRKQGRIILPCKLNDRLGCLGSYQCANCQVNYSVVADHHQATEISK